MKALKWIAIVVVVLIVILLVLPFLIPVNSFRPTIEAKASDALGRKVSLGNLSLSILGGSVGIDNLSIADDPKFNSGPFLTAKNVKVGVELMPLIFSKQLNVTEISIVDPQVTMLKDPSGKWNFSSIGGSSSSTPAQKPAQPASGSKNTEAVSIGELTLEDGQITVGNTNSSKRSVYTKVNLTATDVAMTNSFPAKLSLEFPGGGTMSVDGKVGPVDQTNAAFTPQNAKLNITSLDLAKTGFLDPGVGLAGVVDVDANLVSQGGHMQTKGQLKLSKAVLVAGGSPAGTPAVIDFDTNYDMAAGSGVLNATTLKIGKATTNLSGTYKSVGDEVVLDMKVNGQNLPATDLESFLPALAINLPSGSRLSTGTLNADLHLTGPTNKLVTDGTIGLFNGKLAGFNLGQKLAGVGALAGIKTGNDLEIQKFTSNVKMAPTGLRADNLDLVVPSLGTVVGNGTLDSKNNMDFKLVATVTAQLGGAAGSAIGGIAGQALGGGATNCKNGAVKVPLQVRGTTSNPQFVPDVGGAAASMLKAELGCAGGAGNVEGMAKGLAGGAGGANTSGVVNQLGGLLGGKKKP